MCITVTATGTHATWRKAGPFPMKSHQTRLHGDVSALAMPMRPIDFSREIAKTAPDTSDIRI